MVAAGERSKRLLFVDDDLALHRSLRRLLRKTEFSLESVYHGVSALEAIEREPPDVVLLDVAMPGMSGFEAARLLLEKHPRLPVLLTSGDVLELSRCPGSLTNVQDTLPKPWDHERLIAAMRSACSAETLPSLTSSARATSILVVVSQQRSVSDLRAPLQRPPLDAPQVELVTSLSEALEYLDEHDGVDAILLGLELPDAKGVQAIELLRRETDVPIVALAGPGEEVLRTPVLSSGAQDLVLFGKGCDPREVTRAVARSIDRQRVSERLRRLSSQDSLTAGLNATTFQIVAQQTLADAGPIDRYALLYIRIKNLGRYNEIYGYAAGDRLLRSIANAMREELSQLTPFARLQGANFGALIQLSGGQHAANIAAALISTLTATLKRHAAMADVAPRIGIALAERDGSTGRTLIEAGQAAVVFADDNAGGYCFFKEEMLRARALRDSRALSVLSAAREGGVDVQLEPILSVSGDEPAGLLARVSLSGGGETFVVEEFAPILAAHDELTVLEMGALEKALVAYRRIGPGSGPLIWNVMSKNGIDRIFETVALLAKSLGIQLSDVCLALTEEIISRDSFIAQRQGSSAVAEIPIAICNFGVGRSCLSRLGDLAVSSVQLARQFTRELDTKRGRALCEAILRLADSLDLKSIATGIDSSAQLEFLKTTRCSAYAGLRVAGPDDHDRESEAGLSSRANLPQHQPARDP